MKRSSEVAALIDPAKFEWLRYNGTTNKILTHTRRNGEMIKTRITPKTVFGYSMAIHRPTGKSCVRIVLKDEAHDSKALIYTLSLVSFKGLLKVSKPFKGKLPVMPKKLDTKAVEKIVLPKEAKVTPTKAPPSKILSKKGKEALLALSKDLEDIMKVKVPPSSKTEMLEDHIAMCLDSESSSALHPTTIRTHMDKVIKAYVMWKDEEIRETRDKLFRNKSSIARSSRFIKTMEGYKRDVTPKLSLDLSPEYIQDLNDTLGLISDLIDTATDGIRNMSTYKEVSLPKSKTRRDPTRVGGKSSQLSLGID